MRSEAAERADLTRLHYGQCWEDADLLLEALDIRPGDTCLSIASGGDNTLALLTRDPGRVLAIDMNPAQLASLELRMAAFAELDHDEVLELIGTRESDRRLDLYARCWPVLPAPARRFWDGERNAILAGIGGAGRFERYIAFFRRRVLPLAHRPGIVGRMLAAETPAERHGLYDSEWDNWRWRAAMHLAFSRAVMARAGRDRAFFRYADESLPEHVMERMRRVLTDLPPAENPYVHWLLTGTHGEALPLYLRPENFETIRARLDRVEVRHGALEEVLDRPPARPIHRFNLSNVFEYVSESTYHRMLEALARVGATGARLAYWNMLVPRSRPERMANRLQSLRSLADRLGLRDRVPFYRDFVVEEVA